MHQKPDVQQQEILTLGTLWDAPEKSQLLVLFVDKLFLKIKCFEVFNVGNSLLPLD